MTTISDERLAEIVGAGAPCVPIEPWEVAHIVQELRSLRAQGGVRVKALEWRRSEIIGWNGDWHTVPTAYSIRCADENGWKWSGFGGFGYERSAEAAKAAAQADYERRILSSLEASPAPASYDDAMEDIFAAREEDEILDRHSEASPAPVSEEIGLEKALLCLDGEPEYHHSGMGCGLEDRNIHDRYEAMQYGWDQAMERVYSEHINPAIKALTAALAAKGGK